MTSHLQIAQVCLADSRKSEPSNCIKTDQHSSTQHFLLFSVDTLVHVWGSLCRVSGESMRTHVVHIYSDQWQHFYWQTGHHSTSEHLAVRVEGPSLDRDTSGELSTKASSACSFSAPTSPISSAIFMGEAISPVSIQMEADIWFSSQRLTRVQFCFFFKIWPFAQTQRLK